MRKKIVAANWKMNLDFESAEDLMAELSEKLAETEDEGPEIVIFPPFPYLEMAIDFSEDGAFLTGAQNIHSLDAGPYTGEVSAAMLASMLVDYCIIGHSERRMHFGESDAFLAEKVRAALKWDLTPIFCCGETLDQRNENRHFEVVEAQLATGLFHLPESEFRRVVIAYEPVWAIGTGVNATNEQAQEMHAFIRSLIAGKYNGDTAAVTSILYGGSCNAGNAAGLFAQPDVDGGLIGGASLKADEFLKIIRSFPPGK